MLINVNIRLAKNSDYDVILKLIREYFYKDESVTLSHPEPGHTVDDEDFAMSFIGQDTALVACNSENGNEIVGVLMAGPIDAGDADAMIESSKTATKKWSDVLKLLAYIEQKADILGKFKVDKAFHCHVVAVHRKYRGNGIGRKLFLHFFDLGRNLGYKVSSVDCTSIFTVKIAEKLDMECISTVTYDEYNEIIGENLFRPQEPNLEIKTFAKAL